MNEAERIDYLIKVLEGDNARAFANVTGIRTDTLSRARNGLVRPSVVYTKILAAYPSVRREWLINGNGVPFYEDLEKGEVIKRVEMLTKEVRRLAKLIEGLHTPSPSSFSSKSSSKK